MKFMKMERDYLRKKYDYKEYNPVEGPMYADLMGKIIQRNQAQIADIVATEDRKKFQKNLEKMLPKQKVAKLKLPDTKNLIKKSPTLLKAADQGRLLTKTLSDKLREDVKKSLLSQNITTTTGKVNQNIRKTLESSLKKTFTDYIKVNPRYKMPSNIHTIAVTETRSVINSIRHEYVKEVSYQVQDEFDILKVWIHNDSLSKNPRESHKKLNGQTLPLTAFFNVNGYRAQRPYDPSLPAKETITCNCELEYIFKKSKTEFI